MARVFKTPINIDVPTGTAPFTVSSTTMVTNLNADLLEGYSPATANGASTIVLRDASGNFSAGIITATTFSGSGASLTNLNASNVASGTLPGDRGVTAGSTTASFVEYNGTTATAGQFDGGTTAPSGTTRLNYGGYLYATRFYGDGSNLTNIPGINNGTLTLAVSGTGLSGSASFTANQSGASTFTVTSNANSANGASTIVARDAAGSFAANVITGININATTFAGSGAGLTSIPAANITGSIANAVVATSASGAGYVGMPQNLQTGPYTLVAGDAGKHIYYTASGQTVTIPANGSVAFQIGTTITFITAPSVTLSIAITTDTLRLANTATTGTRTLAANSIATAVKVTSTAWIISGNGLT